jgi:hypothetical protein
MPGRPGLFRLTLRDVDPHAVYFADRSQHTSGVIRHSLMQQVLFRRGSRSPTAAVTLLAPGTRQGALAVALSRPRYSARARTLAYDARPLRATASSLLPSDGRLAKRLPTRFGATSLFIASGDIGGKSCLLHVNDQTPYALDPISTSNWSTDSWVDNPINVYIYPNSGWNGSGWDGGGFLRGCSFSVTYDFDGTRGDTVTLSVTNPYSSSDSPSWDCVPSDRTKYYCSVDFSQSSTSGLVVDIYYNIYRIT